MEISLHAATHWLDICFRDGAIRPTGRRTLILRTTPTVDTIRVVSQIPEGHVLVWAPRDHHGSPEIVSVHRTFNAAVVAARADDDKSKDADLLANLYVLPEEAAKDRYGVIGAGTPVPSMDFLFGHEHQKFAEARLTSILVERYRLDEDFQWLRDRGKT